MNYGDFTVLLAENPVIYSAILIVTLAVYLLVFRKQVNSFFDPLFVVLVFTAFAATDVVFLWKLNEIDTRYFIQFLGTEAAFFVGLALFRPFKGHDKTRKCIALGPRRFLVLWHGGERRFLVVLYLLSAATFVVTQGITYAIRGIPILYASRLGYYSVGGGVGTFDRILSVTWFISCYLLLYCVSTKARIPRTVHFLVGTALVGSAILSGSKSTFMAILFAIFYFRFLRRGDPTCSSFDGFLARLQKITFIFTILAAVLVICIQAASSSPAVVIGTLYVRFASFGDIYFMAYPKHVVDVISGKGAFYAVLGSLLAPFRLIRYEDMPETLGFQIHRIIFGFDDLTGPNARHNVFGLVYFGRVGSMFYSLVLGLIVGFIRNSLAAFVRPGSAIEPLYAFLAISCVWITTDLALVMKDIVSVILVVPALYATAALLCVASARRATPEPRSVLARQMTRPDIESSS